MNDVCLLLEGTYPYVAGGVSTWVYQLIREMPDITFSIVYIGSHRSAVKKRHYEIPHNVTEFRELYVFDYDIRQSRKKRINARDYDVLEYIMQSLRDGDPAFFDQLVSIIGNPKTRAFDLYDIVHSFEAWKVIEHVYSRETEPVSFIDYFWTWRFVYFPFFSLLRADLPQARVYHSVSTGYAGVLGALAKLRYNRPFLLTEHGIYTRERKIDISQADWIYSEDAAELKVTEGSRDFFKEWWISLFSFFSSLAYERADDIISLFDGNKRVQIEEGAPAEKVSIIPNGVDISKFSYYEYKKRNEVLRLGFMGRVVPIKDVKTFIYACHILYDAVPGAQFFIMGPVDEDEDYFRECKALVEMEGLSDVVFFTGKVNIHEYYPIIDILVLTSISESQPIVILEAHASGIPVVATDVGACRELLYGSQPDDKLLGQSGIVTPICNPSATAKAALEIWENEGVYRQMAATGRKRVELYYNIDDLIAQYHMLYSRYKEEIRWQV